MSSSSETEIAAMKLIQESGILNPKMTLGEVFTLTQKIAGMHGSSASSEAIGPNMASTFIYKHFIYKS